MKWPIPLDYGVGVNDDVLTVVSPKRYQAFGVRRNGRIPRAIAGIGVHSGGNIAHNPETILKTYDLRGILLEMQVLDKTREEAIRVAKRLRPILLREGSARQ